MQDVLLVAGALADKNRVRALLAMRAGELCVCQITELLDLAPSTVSKHLSILRDARLINGRKQGRWMYYRIAEGDAPLAARNAMAWIEKTLTGDPRVRADEKRLKAILKEKPEELCKRQCQKSRCCSSAPATRAAAKWPRDGRGVSKAM